uniref:FH2 domain-containing protein n=1 Tax=Pundamilia nyererei TaxID=303518 RepID=A0A3B4FI11_9CICH
KFVSELGHPAGGLKKKRRVRSFFWKTIPEEQVKGRLNLWTQGQVKQKYEIDAQTVEELFGQHDGQSKTLATPARGGKTSSSFRETKQEVSILDAKRGMNIAIFLKQFKRSNETIVDEICHGNSEAFGVERLREMLKLLPESEEVRDTHTHTHTHTHSLMCVFFSDPSFCTHEGEETEGTPRRSLSALIGRFLHVPADSGAQVSAELLLSYSVLCCVQLSLQVSEIRIKPL